MNIKLPKNHCPMALNLFLITIMLCQGGDIVHSIFNGYANDDRSPPSISSSPPTVIGQNVKSIYNSDYSNILSSNLFFRKNVSANQPLKMRLNNLSSNNLNIQLKGTITGSSHLKYAVIKNGNTKKQKLFGEGEIIQGAKLKWVLRDHVVLSRHGRDEILRLQNPERHTTTSNLNYPSSTAEQPVPTSHVVLLRSQLEKQLQNVHELLSQIRITPHREDGVDEGLLLTRILPHSIFEHMGLRNHDILLGIDGKKIKSVDDAGKFYHNLIYAKTLTIQLKRYGSHQSLKYTIQ